MMPDGKTAKRRGSSFRLRSLSRKDALRTGTADAVNLRGISQCGFLMMLMLWSKNGRLAILTGFFDGCVMTVLPV